MRKHVCIAFALHRIAFTTTLANETSRCCARTDFPIFFHQHVSAVTKMAELQTSPGVVPQDKHQTEDSTLDLFGAPRDSMIRQRGRATNLIIEHAFRFIRVWHNERWDNVDNCRKKFRLHHFYDQDTDDCKQDCGNRCKEWFPDNMEDIVSEVCLQCVRPSMDVHTYKVNKLRKVPHICFPLIDGDLNSKRCSCRDFYPICVPESSEECNISLRACKQHADAD